MIRRREFITLLGGAAAWPLAARAQQPIMPLIGFLHNGSPEVTPSLLAGFRKGLSETGYIEGRNVAIEYRWGYNDNDRLPELAADLVRRRVSVIATPNGEDAARAAKAATTTIPIVSQFTGDPVQAGLVSSFNRPGGNVTGVTSLTQELAAKRLGLLHELLPRAARFAVLVNPNNPAANVAITNAQAAALTMGLQVEVLTAGTNREIDMAFASILQKEAKALLLTGSPLFGARRLQLTMLAARHGVPIMYHDRLFAEAGGLMSYGTSFADIYRQVGVYTGRVLKGEKPADLPVMQPTKFELVINLQAARIIGIDVPPTLLALADEVIE
jgi:putative tryptophan/tyrosine transport system substrate-binding protein